MSELSSDVKRYICSFLPTKELVMANLIHRRDKEMWSVLLERDYGEKSCKPYETYRDKIYKKEFGDIFNYLMKTPLDFYYKDTNHRNHHFQKYLKRGSNYLVDSRLNEIEINGIIRDFPSGVTLKDFKDVLVVSRPFGKHIRSLEYNFYDIGDKKGINLDISMEYVF